MAENLTPEQRTAVYDRGGRLLVSAAAGSGKTKVLVDRLLSYITDKTQPADISDFLIITYTKAAASELRAKIADKLSDRIAAEPENRHLQRQVQLLYLTQISTVHGFCSVVLREYAHAVDLTPDFRVADENECKELRNQVVDQLLDKAYSGQLDLPHFMDFIDCQGIGRNDSSVPGLILKVYDSARCHMDPDKWLDRCLHDSDPESFTDASQLPWGRLLIDELHSFLDTNVSLLRELACRMDAWKGMAKPAAVLRSEILMYERFRACDTWDEISREKEAFDTLRFSKKDSDEELAELVKAVRNACKEAFRARIVRFKTPSCMILEDMAQCKNSAQGLIELVRQFSDAYRQLKRSRHLLDFGDLEHCMLDLLYGKKRTVPTAAAAEIGARYREVMVDEYQDSNAVQDAIFLALTEPRQNCFMVGDVKQSIYQFRLADPGIFIDKYNTYTEALSASEGESRRVLLSRNFRSGREVLEAVNDVFRTCMSPSVGGLYYGEAEMLREGVEKQLLPDTAAEMYLLAYENNSNQQEAAFTARRIREMLESGTLVRDGDGMRPVRPNDIVILLRSPGPAGDDYQQALEALGIRCFRGSSNDLLEADEVVTFRALLQTIENPRADIPLISVLSSPLFGFSADDLASVRKAAKGDFFDALCASDLPKAIQFCRTLEELRREAAREPLTVLMERCFTLTGMDSIFGAMEGGKARRENLQNFFRLAADYEKSAVRYPDQFLKHLDNLQGAGLSSAGSSNAGCVTIMSIHKSKGLEFPVVFLCNLSREFNLDSCRDQILCHKDLGLGLSVVDNNARVRYPSAAKQAISTIMTAESVSEEMRVLYVAMTRAKDRLIMTMTCRKPEDKLKNIALRISAGGIQLLCQEARSPSDWLLMEAVQRTEAGELHALGGKALHTHLREHPWKIRVYEPDEADDTELPVFISSETPMEKKDEINGDELDRELKYKYPFPAAVSTPSKQTATGRRIGSSQTKKQVFTSDFSRRPDFARTSIRQKGTDFGNAVHRIMQFIDFRKCTNAAAVAAEIDRLVAQRLLPEHSAHGIPAEMIAGFFSGEPGKKLLGGAEFVREFHFSLLDDAANYADGLAGEQVLLQGVVDLAILEPEGITIIDYKTDRVSPENIEAAACRHKAQLDVYAEAMSRIFECRVIHRYLYFFRSGVLYRV